MSKIIIFHSFRRGTGKSNLVANVAALLAGEGKQVGIIDTDLQSPGIQCIFGLEDDKIHHTLNDYLWGKCKIAQAAHLVLPDAGQAAQPEKLPGQVYLVPASAKASEVARMSREGYDIELLNDGFYSLIQELGLEVLLIDTHAGLSEYTFASIAAADALAVIMRLDHQDYQGTSLIIEVARQLDLPAVNLIVNEVPPTFDLSTIKAEVEQSYGCRVAAVLPHSDELLALASSDTFVRRYPDHPVTFALKQLTATLIQVIKRE